MQRSEARRKAAAQRRPAVRLRLHIGDEPSGLRPGGVVAKRETTAPLACRHLASPMADAITSLPDLSTFSGRRPGQARLGRIMLRGRPSLLALLALLAGYPWRDSITRFLTRHSMCARSRPDNEFCAPFSDPVLSRSRTVSRLDAQPDPVEALGDLS